jgi:putative Ca2+/H+ antiporter (TMEM165/GDT1 family)
VSATPRRWSPLVIYRIALVAAVCVFHRRVLFDRDFIFPWDFRAVHVPLATLIADAFRRGEFPLWDPYTYCGMPIFANIQAALFYPPGLAATGAGAIAGDALLPKFLAISVVIQIAFAGLCAFELMRKLDVRPAAAWIGASVFELGCFFAAQAEHMGAMQGAVWLPLIWLAVLQLREFRRRWLAILALALAMTVFAGLPQVAVAAFSSAISLAILLALFRAATWRVPAVTSLAALFALAAAAVQLFPTAELTYNSVAKYRSEWLGTGGGIPPGALLSLIIPNYWNVFDLSKFHGPTDLTFLYLYSSILGLALALGAIIWKPGLRDREAWSRVFAAMLVIFTFGMLGDQTTLGRVALAALPIQLRIGIHPEFLFCVFSLALAVLAGLGAERLLPSSRLQIAAGIVIVCDLILVSSGRPMNQNSTKLEPGIAHDSVDGSPEIIARLREITGRAVPPYRFDARPGVPFLWSSSAPVIGIPTANGCDPLAPERTIDARLAFASGPRWGTCYQVENPNSPMLNLMNVRALLSLTPGGYQIQENTAVLERFFFVPHVQPVNTLAQAASVVQSPEFRPSEDAVVEAPGEKIETFAPGVVHVISYTASAIQLTTTASAPAFLVATESYYPGWEASIDGTPAHIYPTDAAFRGVMIPAGTHTVDFRFVPRTLYRSAIVSALALAALLVCLV